MIQLRCRYTWALPQSLNAERKTSLSAYLPAPPTPSPSPLPSSFIWWLHVCLTRHGVYWRQALHAAWGLYSVCMGHILTHCKHAMFTEYSNKEIYSFVVRTWSYTQIRINLSENKWIKQKITIVKITFFPQCSLKIKKNLIDTVEDSTSPSNRASDTIFVCTIVNDSFGSFCFFKIWKKQGVDSFNFRRM